MLYSRSLLVTYLTSRGGEGSGNPLQCSCLENPRDGGAWWAAIYGVAQSWTRLKRLSSSSSSSVYVNFSLPVFLPTPAPGNYKFVLYICDSLLFCKYIHLYHINDIIWYLSFFVRDTSLSTTFFGSIVL